MPGPEKRFVRRFPVSLSEEQYQFLAGNRRAGESVAGVVRRLVDVVMERQGRAEHPSQKAAPVVRLKGVK